MQVCISSPAYLVALPAAGISLVQSATQVNESASSSDAPPITINGTTVGNTLVAFASIYDGNTTFTLTSVTDGANTFTVRSGVNTRAGDRSYAVVAVAPITTGGNRTVTFNLSGTSGAGGRYFALGCLEFSGIAAAAFEDAFDSNDEIDISATDISAGPITTTLAGDLIVGCAAANVSDSTMNFASPASWANSYRQNDASAVSGMDAGYWLPGATQTDYTAQWSHDNTAGGEGCGVVVAVKRA